MVACLEAACRGDWDTRAPWCAGGTCEGLRLEARGAVRAQLLPLSTMYMLATRNVTLVRSRIIIVGHEPITQDITNNALERG